MYTYLFVHFFITIHILRIFFQSLHENIRPSFRQILLLEPVLLKIFIFERFFPVMCILIALVIYPVCFAAELNLGMYFHYLETLLIKKNS